MPKDEVQQLRREKEDLEELLIRATEKLSELIPLQRSVHTPRMLPDRVNVTGLTGFEKQTTGSYALSYFCDGPSLERRTSIVYEREHPEPPASLVYMDGAWSIRRAVDSPDAFLRAMSPNADNPTSLPVTAWEIHCPGKFPRPWVPAPKSFSVTGHSETGLDGVEETFKSPHNNSLDGLNDDEFMREVGRRRYRRQRGGRVPGEWLDKSAAHNRSHRSPRRETALEREARMARRGPRRQASPDRTRGSSPTKAARPQLVEHPKANYSYMDSHKHQHDRYWAKPISQYYRSSGALRPESPTGGRRVDVERISPHRLNCSTERVGSGNAHHMRNYAWGDVDSQVEQALSPSCSTQPFHECTFPSQC